MYRFVLKRLTLAVACVWGVTTLVFLMTKLIPGDAARVAAGRTATPDQVAQARERLGLDDPVWQQYLHFLGRAVRGDLGQSASTHQPVTTDLAHALPATLQLVLVALALTVLIGLPLGVVAAARQGSGLDGGIRLMMIVVGGIPIFWLAILLQWTLASTLGIFPISGSNTFGSAPPEVTGMTLVDSVLAGNPAAFTDSFAHLVLPALALSTPFLTTTARNVRSNMIGGLASDYVAFAAAKGASERRVLIRHVLRATMSSTVTLLGMQFGWMIGAAILAEAIFGIPGVGTYLSAAVLSQDTFAVLGTVIAIGAVFTLSSLLVDVFLAATDPRARASFVAGGAR